ncbi:MAG TPA: hypothetical protein ENN81_09100 [Phycisphaerales bacterium]|mgnify:CR=1 FL=1|nr:hypothetical protein [Phycisphaerales bacterium]
MRCARKSTLWVLICAVVLVGLAVVVTGDDVVVQDGKVVLLAGQINDLSGTVSLGQNRLACGGATINGSTTINGTTTITSTTTTLNGTLSVTSNASVGSLTAAGNGYFGDDLEVYGSVGYNSTPNGYFSVLYGSLLTVHGDMYAYNGDIYYDLDVGADLTVTGKVASTGGYDPPYVLYDQQSREQIVERVKREVPPDKQGGAALFFNAQTKRLEVYVPAVGTFYDLLGNEVRSLATPEVATQYEVEHYLDPDTGEVLTRQKVVVARYMVKKGYRLDRKTGQFVDEKTGHTVSKQVAVEITNGG